MFEKKICPKCGEKELVEVLYGLPTEEAFEASLKGLIKLEGCCLPEGYNGEDIYYCNNRFINNLNGLLSNQSIQIQDIMSIV